MRGVVPGYEFEPAFGQHGVQMLQGFGVVGMFGTAAFQAFQRDIHAFLGRDVQPSGVEEHTVAHQEVVVIADSHKDPLGWEVVPGRTERRRAA